MPSIRSLSLTITEQDQDLKLVWSTHNTTLAPYSVNTRLLTKTSEQVRAILGEISTACNGGGDYQALLRPLAIAGEKLKASLFTTVSGSDDAAEQIRDVIDTLSERIPLTVYSDGKVHVPWGFVFNADPRRVPECTGTLADFANFWTTLFSITIRFNKAQIMHDEEISGADLGMLYALHEELFRNAREILKDEPYVLSQIEELHARHIGETTDWDDCRDKWEEIADQDSIVYIFGHSDGERIYLSDRDDEKYALDTTGFLTTFRKKRQTKSRTIYFINGCRTGGGPLGDGFLGVTSGTGFHGFIGTEAAIANDFAARYALHFLSKMLDEGKSVGETIEVMRLCKDYFPRSLFYTCFANPDFRINPNRGVASSGRITQIPAAISPQPLI